MPRAGCCGIWMYILCQISLTLLVWVSPTTAQSGNETHTLPLNATIPNGQVTGSGYAFAESCQAELRSWSTASSSYGRENGERSTSYYTGIMTLHSAPPASTSVTSIITLCDGHPRVVGQVSYEHVETTKIITSTWTNTNPTFVFASYPTPAPCSIRPDDCELLYSSWTSHYSVISKGSSFGGLLDPPCTTRTSSYSFSTDLNGNVCDNCQIIGSKIRLLFWPVVTEVGGPNNLCNETARTISATPTGNGPNTFETLGITITSPSIAVSIGGLSRVDGCGKTVASTVIPVRPEDISSVEGARALFTHRPFNFANLNYKCMSDPDNIYFATSDRTDCYQEVPASAYFYGYANAAGAEWWNSQAFANSTIWPSYQPQVLPPNTLTAAIKSIWGDNCNIHPDGVWDPPIALGHEKSIPLPTAPDSPPEYATPTSNPAMPALPTYAHPSVTPADDCTTSTKHQASTAAGRPTTSHNDFFKDPGEPDASKQHASKDTDSPNMHPIPGGTVHAVHTTIFTFPAKSGKDTLTAMYGSHGLSLANEGTTILVSISHDGNQGSYGPGMSYAISQISRDPARSHSIHQQIMTIGKAEYTVRPLKGEAVELIGQSTTVTIHQEDTHTTRSIGSLALATGRSSTAQIDAPTLQSSTQNPGDSSTSSASVSKTMMTCIYLSLLAVSAAIFL